MKTMKSSIQKKNVAHCIQLILGGAVLLVGLATAPAYASNATELPAAQDFANCGEVPLSAEDLEHLQLMESYYREAMEAGEGKVRNSALIALLGMELPPAARRHCGFIPGWLYRARAGVELEDFAAVDEALTWIALTRNGSMGENWAPHPLVEPLRLWTEERRDLRLHEAVQDPEALRRLLAEGHNPNAPNTVDEAGLGSLAIAVSKNQRESVEILLEYGADPNQASPFLGPVLGQVRPETDPAIVELLWDNGLRPQWQDGVSKRNLLFYASHLPVDQIQRLLHSGLDPGHLDFEGDTALHRFIGFGAPAENIALLLEAGADPNAVNHAGDTPLNCRFNTYQLSAEIIRLLLDAGADVNAQDAEGDTVFHHLAGAYNTDEQLKLLVEAGANPNLVNHDGLAPIHFASAFVENNPREIDRLHWFFAVGVSGGTIEAGAQTPLITNVRNHNLEQIKATLARGADPNEPDQRGLPPLFWAFHTKAPLPIIEALLVAGGDADTALDSRLREGHRTIRQTFAHTMNTYMYVDPHKELIEWTQGVLDLIIEQDPKPEE